MSELSFDEVIRRSVELTPTQRRVLYIASFNGFYEFPRKVTLTELASLIGIKPSTLSEILRGAERKVMRRYAEAVGKPLGRPRN